MINNVACKILPLRARGTMRSMVEGVRLGVMPNYDRVPLRLAARATSPGGEGLR